MASSLPAPIRIVAGLVGTVADRVQSLPQDLPQLGVTVVGHAFRLSLKARQQLAQLSVRGDELLAGLRSAPSDTPAWATFVEDLDPARDDASDRSDASGTTDAADATDPTDSGRPTDSGDQADSGAPSSAAGSAGAAGLAAGGATEGAPAGEGRPGPAGWEDLADLTIAQLRDRLQDADVDTLRAGLAAEENGRNRPAYLTLLTNRLTARTQQ